MFRYALALLFGLVVGLFLFEFVLRVAFGVAVIATIAIIGLLIYGVFKLTKGKSLDNDCL